MSYPMSKNKLPPDSKSAIIKMKQSQQVSRMKMNKKNIVTWDDYEAFVQENDPAAARDMEEMHAAASIISELIAKRNALGLSQRELAKICDLPQSSVARIESLRSTPRLDTLLKLSQALNLQLTLTPNPVTA